MHGKRDFRWFILFMIALCAAVPALEACDGCGCTLARCGLSESEAARRWFFDFTVEGQNWDKRDSAGAHTLHHQGHHVHNKTSETFYHHALGFNATDRLTVLAELPYVRRLSTEVDSHARLGHKEFSEGVGDLDVTLTWRFLRNEEGFLGLVGGVKFPTGSTTELNSGGDRFEPELQPGSGSYDGKTGLAFRRQAGPWRFQGNALYTWKTEGDQEFEYGDAFSSYLVADRAVGRIAPGLRAGADLKFESAGKDREAGVRQADSGGETLLAGPSVTWEAGPDVSLFGNFLFPVYQELGGVHQEVDFAWNAGCKILW
ncbi:MAG TPA: hypothetical protein VL404_02470 [Candidatus Eisenbacteria bacterium]|nr:hypothetical protein [Candidatus Eisenbacteria bacterium]